LVKRYNLVFSRQAKKDVEKLTPTLKEKAKHMCRLLSENPYSGKALVGNLKGYYSMRLSHKDRIVYSIDNDEGEIHVLRVKTHYGE